MAAARTSLTGSWVKLADAGSFLIVNSGPTHIEIAIQDTPPTDLATTFTLPPYGQISSSTYAEDIYGRGPGAVTLLATA